MSDSKSGKPTAFGDGRLRAALETARTQQAVRFDAIEEGRVLQVARLQALADNLQPVFDDITDGGDVFMCSVVPGDPPRLWIDMLAYVSLSDDGRTYRLTVNNRAGRQILAESAEIKEISDHVVGYIAHRMIDRERSLASPQDRTSGTRGARYGGVAVAMAWACGFAVGALVLFALVVIKNGGL